ncbi:MAG: hypothetical protein IT359_21170 [Gemmatimonadaceae bacterium]|nr:hypothetical protein [Gemmatimonadaceae bacterium]
MRRLIARSFVLSIIALAATSSVARAQRGGGAPPFGGPRPEFAFDLSDGEPVSFYLEWARVLELTPAQKSGLIEIRRRLRLQNAPFMHQLDSLRELSGVDLTSRRRVTEDDREAVRRFQLVAAPVMDSIKVNNDGARREIGVLLDARQAARADSVSKAMREARNRRDERGAGRRPGEPNEQRQAPR